MKSLAFVGLLALISYTQAQNLQCYQCKDCVSLGDTKPSYCGPTTPMPEPTTEPTTDDTTDDTTTETETTTDAPTETDSKQKDAALMLLQNYRSFSRNRRDTTTEDSYACYTVDVTVDGKTHLNRGCVSVPKNEKGCDIIDKVTDGDTSNCYLCQSDGCNSSAIAQVSFIALLCVLIAKYVF